jgi:hypothetical protein
MIENAKKYILVRLTEDKYHDHGVVRASDDLEKIREYPSSESTYAIYELKYRLDSTLSRNITEVRPITQPGFNDDDIPF